MLLGLAIAIVCGFLLGLALMWKRPGAAPAGATARPQVADAQAAARLRAAIDAAPVAIIAATLDGRVTLWSRGAQRIFGWRREEVEGRDLPFAASDEPREATLRERLGAGNEIRDQAIRRTDRDGDVRDLTLNAVAERDAGGAVIGYVSVMEDVTERRRGGAMPQPPTGAPRNAGADARFLSLISHDLRQPIQALSLVTGALERRATDPAMRELIDHLAAVVRSTQSTFEAIVEWSKLEGGQIASAPVPFAVDPVMASLAEQFGEEAARRGLHLRHVRSSAQVLCDPTLVRRILHHLLDNAMKFTAAGTVLLGARRHGGALRIMVADTGIGISPEQRAAALAPFSQLDSGREAGGLGLGLAIAQRLATLAGATVDYRSTPGRGSVFWIEVPRA